HNPPTPTFPTRRSSDLSPAHPASTEELAAIVHHGRLVRGQDGKLLAVAQRIDDLTAHAGLARGRRVRVPDVLAVQLAASARKAGDRKSTRLNSSHLGIS